MCVYITPKFSEPSLKHKQRTKNKKSNMNSVNKTKPQITLFTRQFFFFVSQCVFFIFALKIIGIIKTHVVNTNMFFQLF
jgi:hypothetical protein